MPIINGVQYDGEELIRKRVAEIDVEYAGEPMPEEARDEWNELNAHLDEFDKRRERIRELSTRPANCESEHVSRERRESMNQGLYAIERHASRMPSEATDRLEALVRRDDRTGLEGRYLAAVGNEDYNSAFGKMLFNPQDAHLRFSQQETEAVRVVSEIMQERALSLTGSAGGFAVPFELDPTIMLTSNGATNPIREIARVRPISVDEWRGISSTGVTASYAAEATETTDNAPTLAQPTISTEKAQAFIPFSIEIGMDWRTMQQDLGAALADAKDVLEAAKFVTGTGTNEPFGVITGATTTVAAGAGGTFTLANLFALQEALPARYRGNASFLADLPIYNKIRQFTIGDEPVFGDSITEAAAGRMLGKNAYEASEMTDVTTNGAKFLLYGDFSRYVIAERIGLEIELIPHLMGANRRPTGERGLYAYWRNGAKVVDANAFRVLIGQA